MKVRLDFEYQGVRDRDGEYPGTFVRMVELPQVPAIGEAIALGGHFTAKVSWVLWRLEGAPEVHLEVHPGHEASAPTRADLTAGGWHEA